MRRADRRPPARRSSRVDISDRDKNACWPCKPKRRSKIDEYDAARKKAEEDAATQRNAFAEFRKTLEKDAGRTEEESG